jgi:hypothetical protein
MKHFHIIDDGPRELDLAHRAGDIFAPLSQDDDAIPGFGLRKVERGAILTVKVVVALQQLERRAAVLAVHVVRPPCVISTPDYRPTLRGYKCVREISGKGRPAVR